MTFKNDTERIAYLDAFKEFDNPEKTGYAKEWAEMLLDTVFGRRWLYVIPAKDVFFIVEQAYQTIEWPKKHLMWRTKNWYIVEGQLNPADDKICRTPSGATLEDCAASRTQALQRLKELEKEGRLK